jgi:antitoxin HicB
MAKLDTYPFEVRPLAQHEGSGFLITYPDFDECISDGETVEEAIANGRDALQATISALEAKGYPVPAPGRALCSESAH